MVGTTPGVTGSADGRHTAPDQVSAACLQIYERVCQFGREHAAGSARLASEQKPFSAETSAGHTRWSVAALRPLTT